MTVMTITPRLGWDRTLLVGSALLIVFTMVLLGESPSAQLLAFLLPFLAVVHLSSKGFHNSQLSWMLPLTGYMATFLIGAGLSASNRDIRTMVEIVGVGMCGTFTVMGTYYSFKTFRHQSDHPSGPWRRHIIGGMACNLFLALLITLAAHASYEAKTRSEVVGSALTDR